MTREDICKGVVELRKASGLKMKEVCVGLDTTPSIIYRFEKGTNNFDVHKLFDYLKVLGGYAEVVSDSTCDKLYDYEGAMNLWFHIRKDNGYSQRRFAEKIGTLSHTITNIELNKTALTIDVFLKACNALDFTVNIKKKGGNE